MKDENIIVTSDNNVNGTEPAKQHNEAQKKKNVKAIISAVVIIQLVLAVFAGFYLFRTGFENEKTNRTKKIREDAYNRAYDATEASYHTSNRAYITLKEIKEKADLEVLQVSSNYLYISDRADQEKNLTIWYEIPGTGTYSIDLQMTEFIVDAERNHVLVKAPLPEVRIREEEPKPLEYKDDRLIPIIQGSISEGAEIGRKMLYQARSEMTKELEANAEYAEAAKDSAKKLITNIIKSLNPSIQDLYVTVEFMDNL